MFSTLRTEKNGGRPLPEREVFQIKQQPTKEREGSDVRSDA
jgi:hypothetical protein